MDNIVKNVEGAVKEVIGFFEESKGARSMMRLLVFLVVCVALLLLVVAALAFIVVLAHGKDSYGALSSILALAGIGSGLISFALGAKVWQRAKENQVSQTSQTSVVSQVSQTSQTSESTGQEQASVIGFHSYDDVPESNETDTPPVQPEG